MPNLLTFIEENYVEYKPTKYKVGYIHTFYNDLFTPLQDKSLEILEIGIYKGQSLKLWHDYFYKSNITGVDILEREDTKLLQKLNRIKLLYEDAYQEKFVQNLKEKTFDIVIDDGPHTFTSMKFFLENYLSKVSSGGLMILEDIENLTWIDLLIESIKDENFTIYNTKNRMFGKYKNNYPQGLGAIVVKKD